MPTLCRLPPEILEMIFLLLGRESLMNIALVSNQLHDPAIALLYQRILPLDARQTIALLWTLVQVPSSAKRIRTLHIRAPFTLARDVFTPSSNFDPPFISTLHSSSWQDRISYWVARAVLLNSQHAQKQARTVSTTGHPVHVQREEQFFDSKMASSIPISFVEQAFRNMTCLQTLVIHSGTHPLFWRFSFESPVLNHVHVHNHADSPMLLWWLAKQSSIHTLRYSLPKGYTPTWFSNEGPEVEEHFIPNLSTFRTNIRGGMLWVPGRPVRELHLETFKEDLVSFKGATGRQNDNSTLWATDIWDAEKLGSSLRRSKCGIETLTFSVPSSMHLDPLLQMVANQLPSVKHLKIVMHYEDGLITCLDRHMASLRNIQVLECPARDLIFPRTAPLEKDEEIRYELVRLNHKIKSPWIRHPNLPSQVGPATEEEDDWRANQFPIVTKWASSTPNLNSVVFHSSSPIIQSQMDNSVVHGSLSQDFVAKWSITRDGASVAAELVS